MLRRIFTATFAVLLLFLYSCSHPSGWPNPTDTVMTTQASTENFIICPSSPPPIFYTCFLAQEDYEAFFKNEEYSLPLLSTDSLSAFGEFSEFEVSVHEDGFEISYKYVFEDVYITLKISPLTYDGNLPYDVIWIEDGDVSENLYMYPVEYWLRLPDETVYDQLSKKYFSNINERHSLRYQVSENIYIRYVTQNHTDMVFVFEGYEITVAFGENKEALKYGNNIVCPTTKALLTKSTSKEAAEELYNLWKTALK